MRKRTLSDDGLHLFLNGVISSPPKRGLRNFFCQLFHSDYDDRLFDVVYKCRHSTQAMAAQFNQPDIKERLDASILHTIRLILTRDNKKVHKKHIKHNFRFFMDVMKSAYQQNDHQTAHMMYLALTHPAISNLNIKERKNDPTLLHMVSEAYGSPNYKKHIDFWRQVRSDAILPSLIAFNIYITRLKFKGELANAEEACQMIDIFKYLEHNPYEILPIYNQKRLSNTEILKLSKKLKSQI